MGVDCSGEFRVGELYKLIFFLMSLNLDSYSSSIQVCIQIHVCFDRHDTLNGNLSHLKIYTSCQDNILSPPFHIIV